MRAITVATVSGLLAASFCVAYAVRPAALVAARAPVTHAVFVAPEALTAVVQKRCAEPQNPKTPLSYGVYLFEEN